MLFGFFITSQNVLRKCNFLHVHVTIPGVRLEAESTITIYYLLLRLQFLTSFTPITATVLTAILVFVFVGEIDGSSRAHAVESMPHKECAS